MSSINALHMEIDVNKLSEKQFALSASSLFYERK